MNDFPLIPKAPHGDLVLPNDFIESCPKRLFDFDELMEEYKKRLAETDYKKIEVVERSSVDRLSLRERILNEYRFPRQKFLKMPTV